MKIFFILLAVLGLSVSEFQQGTDKYSNLQITNGRPANSSITFQVFLIITNTYGPRWCSGTLITENYVLTAAYCIEKASKVEARLGVYNRTDMQENVQSIKAEAWTQHPEFNMSKNERERHNDVGLVKLESPAVLNDVVSLVKLSATDPLENQPAKLTGWGLTGYTEDSALVLMEADVKVISNQICKETYSYISESNICTLGDNGEGYCNGDQGGPLLVEDDQVGITSFGDRECRKEYPTYYSSVVKFLRWIEKNSDYKST